MEIYKLETESKEIEWKGTRFEDARIVWSVDPVLRQFEVTLDDIRGWDKMPAMAKTAALTYLWAHFQEEEVSAFSAFISSRFGWPVTATKVTLPFEVDHEISDASDWISFEGDSGYTLPFSVHGGIVGWKDTHPLKQNDESLCQEAQGEDVDDFDYLFDEEHKELSQFDSEISSALFAADSHIRLVQMLLKANGHNPSESVESVSSLIHSLKHGDAQREWQTAGIDQE